MEFDPTLDIREAIAYPKRWQAKANPPVPYQKYPHRPLIQHRDDKGELTGKANVPIFDKQGQPLIWQSARDEVEWLKDHPKEASLIAEAKAAAPVTLDTATSQLAATNDKNKRLEAERDESDRKAQQAMDELAAAKAELAAMRKVREVGSDTEKPSKLDMRTKEGRAAAKAAETGNAS